MNREKLLEHLTFAQKQLEKVRCKPDDARHQKASRIYQQIITHLTKKLSHLPVK